MSLHWSRDGLEAEPPVEPAVGESPLSLARPGFGAAEEVPEAPADLGATGHAFWERLWSSCDGISPVADHEAVAEIARLMDDQEIVRCRATRTADLRELRVVIARSRALSSSLASLGFNLEPTLDSG